MIGERNRFAPDIVEAINGLEEKDEREYRNDLRDRRKLWKP